MKKEVVILLVVSVFLMSSCHNSFSGKCGIEQCHGLDITCGPNVPEICTLQYQLGDFCRQYVSCEEVQGSCQQVQSDLFDACKKCVSECEDGFLCEDNCRLEMNEFQEAAQINHNFS